MSGGAVDFENVTGQKNGKLYQYAEYALDRAKQAGKNELEFFNEADYAKEIDAIALLEELEESVKNDCQGFSLVYQPQIKGGSYRLFGAEALLRYESPTRGRVMPMEFVPLLEESGLICEVGMWVLRTALSQCKAWQERLPDFHVSVNVSYVQLAQPDIMEQVLKTLEESGLGGDALTLEITESMQLDNLSYYNKVFEAWKKAGIEISLDDFGTGYSNFEYLKYLKVDEIKIDRCFVTGIQNSSYNYRLLCNMLDFAAGAQARVCCEGVEEREELQVLEELKPDLLQGYLFSKPCDVKQFEQVFFERENADYKEWHKRAGVARTKRFGRLLKLRHRDILKAANLGLWIIRLNEKSGSHELYADETMLRVLGADNSLTPEECYRHWHSRIKEEYLDYVNQAVEKMISGDKMVQLQYLWMHPVLGEVEVRCNGIRMEDMDGMCCLEGYHRMVNNIEITHFEKEERTK